MRQTWFTNDQLAKTDGLLTANVAAEGAKDGGRRRTATPGLIVTSGQPLTATLGLAKLSAMLG